MLRVLLKLKPLDLKFTLRMISESRAGLVSANKLAETPADLPGILGKLKKLKKMGLIELDHQTDILMVVFCKPLKNFADHLFSFTETLDFTLAEADLTDSPPVMNHSSKRMDMIAVVEAYAALKGIPKESIDSEFIGRHARGAVALLSTAKSVERAKQVMGEIKNNLEKQGLDWSLNGAVVNNMHKTLQKIDKTKGGWEW